jgi:thiamine-phosphate pyrophosphorylase
VDGTQRLTRLARSRLYLVLEADAHRVLDAALAGGVDVVQLRDKELGNDDLVRAAEPFRHACEAHGALFVLNDRPDLVERCGADGVHVGQDDLPLADARRLVGADRIVGVSVTQASELSNDADYVGVGAIFGTPTKPESPAGGLELVRAARDALRVPWFAIGGVDESNVEELVANGAPGVAVVRAIRDAGDPAAAAQRLRAELPPSSAIVTGAGANERALLPQLEVLEWTTEPGGFGAKPHTHALHADAFYVLDGELEFRVSDETVRVPTGTAVAAPPGLVHGFRNPGKVEARWLNVHAPGVWYRARRAKLPTDQYDTYGVEPARDGLHGTVSGPGDGDRLVKAGRLALAKVQRPELDLLEYAAGVGYDGAGLHLHLRHADGFYVLDGALAITADGETHVVEPGGCAVVPPGVPHSFAMGDGVERVRFLNLHAPSYGFTEHLRSGDDGSLHDIVDV